MAKGKGTGSYAISAAMERDWRTEGDLRTLQEAEEIRRDPARLKRAQELAKKKLVEIAAVAGEASTKT